jgi:hypothetical protein
VNEREMKGEWMGGIKRIVNERSEIKENRKEVEKASC